MKTTHCPAKGSSKTHTIGRPQLRHKISAWAAKGLGVKGVRAAGNGDRLDGKVWEGARRSVTEEIVVLRVAQKTSGQLKGLLAIDGHWLRGGGWEVARISVDWFWMAR